MSEEPESKDLTFLNDQQDAKRAALAVDATTLAALRASLQAT